MSGIKTSTNPTTRSSGVETFSSSGVQLTFLIPHKLNALPQFVGATPLTDDTLGCQTSFDATNIIINYDVAPPVGTSNVIFNWFATL